MAGSLSRGASRSSAARSIRAADARRHPLGSCSSQVGPSAPAGRRLSAPPSHRATFPQIALEVRPSSCAGEPRRCLGCLMRIGRCLTLLVVRFHRHGVAGEAPLFPDVPAAQAIVPAPTPLRLPPAASRRRTAPVSGESSLAPSRFLTGANSSARSTCRPHALGVPVEETPPLLPSHAFLRATPRGFPLAKVAQEGQREVVDANVRRAEGNGRPTRGRSPRPSPC